jgi:hypothetical protein
VLEPPGGCPVTYTSARGELRIRGSRFA